MGTLLTFAEQRLRDLETLFIWEGALDNARIRSVFGLQPVQASRLVTSFVAAHGAGVQRITPHAPVTPTHTFTPKFESSGADDYLRLVESVRPNDMAPYVHDLRQDLVPVAASLFSLVVQACRTGTGLDIHYRTMAEPQGLPRRIFPHALVRAARRWHVRAWCDLRQDFRDFALGRIANAASVAASRDEGTAPDAQWDTIVQLEVGAHPALSATQQELIRHEYLAGAASKTLEVRQALAGYIVQDLRIATDISRDVPPEYQLSLCDNPLQGGQFWQRK